ncbi:MAG: MFS transporter small subunit [Nocardioidaceae bacterium]
MSNAQPNAAQSNAGQSSPATPSNTARLVVAWGLVGIPLAYGVSQTLEKVVKLFGG